MIACLYNVAIYNTTYQYPIPKPPTQTPAPDNLICFAP